MMLVRRSLSTLGEMLAMLDLKKEDLADQVPPHVTNQLCSNEQRLGVPPNHYVGNGEGSLRKISRSRSVPVSSPTFDSLRIDGGCSGKECATPKEEVKPKNGKSSLKGKISSFFSKHKKVEKEKVTSSPLGTSNGLVPLASNAASINSNVSQPVCTSLQHDAAWEILEDQFESGPTVVLVNEPEAPFSSKSPISLEKTLSFEIRNSHFDQPSPTSVLDVFEDVNEKSPSSSESAIPAK